MEWIRKLKPKHYIFMAVGLLTVIILRNLFTTNHIPARVSYDKETREVIISPGWFYTLEGYETRHSIPEGAEALPPLSAPTDPEYRFRVTTDKESIQEEMVIYTRDELTGKPKFHVLDVHRQWESTTGSCWYMIFCTGPAWLDVVDNSFYVYPEE